MPTDVVVMFDADGTLVNTMGLHADLARDCIVGHFVCERGWARQEYLRTAGAPFPRQLETIFPGDEYLEARNACVREYIERKGREVYGNAHVFPDVPKGLQLLDSGGIPLTVSTSTEKAVMGPVLTREQIIRYFRRIDGLEQGSKPHHIETVRREFDPRKLFFVGDTLSDVLLKEHGVVTIGRYGKPEDGMRRREELLDAGAAYVTDNFRTLLEFIKK